MKYLFVKDGCQKCQYIKNAVDLDKLGVTIMDVETAEGLKELAWHELKKVAETILPILVLDDGSHITGALPIKEYLLNLK